LSGDNRRTGYRLGDSNPWRNTTQFVAEFALASTEDFSIFFRIRTDSGYRYLYYSHYDSVPQQNSYIYTRLNAGTSDGKWHVHTLDLQQDLRNAEPSNTLLSVEYMLIRGDALIDDIKLSGSSSPEPLSTQGIVATTPPISAPTPTAI